MLRRMPVLYSLFFRVNFKGFKYVVGRSASAEPKAILPDESAPALVTYSLGNGLRKRVSWGASVSVPESFAQLSAYAGPFAEQARRQPRNDARRLSKRRRAESCPETVCSSSVAVATAALGIGSPH